MGQEIREQFDKLGKQIERLSADVSEFFGFVRGTVATKEDLKEELKGFATKEDLQRFATKEDLDSGLSEIRSELRSIDDRLTRLEIKVAALAKGSNEDIDALADDYVFIRRRLDAVVQALYEHGISLPKVELDNHHAKGLV